MENDVSDLCVKCSMVVVICHRAVICHCSVSCHCTVSCHVLLTSHFVLLCYGNKKSKMGLSENLENPTTEKSVKMQDKKEKPLTKVIIRRLPPTITQETFLNQVSPVPDYDHIYTVGGDASLGEYSFARVYISFVNPDDVFTFKEKFDNYVFVDAKGHEYPAVVEFAAFQRIPKKRNKQKTDPKCGTIETDPVYLEFLELLKQQPQSEEKPEFSLQLTNSETKTDVTTPLLEFIKQRRVEKQRVKEERREERKRREFERRKMRDDDRRKHFADKSPIAKKEEEDAAAGVVVVEKAATFKNKEKKFEERRGFAPKTKYPPKSDKKDYYEKKMEFKNRRSEFKSSKYQEDVKKPEEPKTVKKVKKYSERREERKHTTKSAENKTEETISEEKNLSLETPTTEGTVTADVVVKEKESKSKENDPRVQRRIRNKDRPAMAIYQPGMLSKRKQAESASGDDAKPSNKNKEQ